MTLGVQGDAGPEVGGTGVEKTARIADGDGEVDPVLEIALGGRRVEVRSCVRQAAGGLATGVAAGRVGLECTAELGYQDGKGLEEVVWPKGGGEAASCQRLRSSGWVGMDSRARKGGGNDGR